MTGRQYHYIYTSPNNSTYYVDHPKKFCEEHGLTCQHMRRCALKGGKHHGWTSELVNRSEEEERIDYCKRTQKFGKIYNSDLKMKGKEHFNKGRVCKPFTDKHRSNISKSFNPTPVFFAAIQRTHRGKLESTETRNKKSVSMMGNTNGEHQVWTKEQRMRLSWNQMGVWNSNWRPCDMYKVNPTTLDEHMMCLTEWCRNNSINRWTMWLTTIGVIDSHNGFKAQYIDNY